MQAKAAMSQLCDIQIHVNGHQTFFLNQKIITKYSERLKKIIKQERSSVIEINGFPGGPTGFELVSRFCYNNGRIKITVSNVSLLYCCSIFLGMTNNLLQQTESFLEGMLHWSWSDIILSLQSCESIFAHADSCGLIEKFICALLAKIAQNSDSSSLVIASSSSPSSSSSHETSSGFRLSCNNPTKTTPESKPCSSSSSSSPPSKAWWFDDLTILSPLIIEKIIKGLGAYYGVVENDSLVLTRFLLHYLKSCVQVQSKCGGGGNNGSYSGLADTAVYGVILVGKCSFSCRKLFWVLRIASNFGISKDSRDGLEKTIGGMLDEATLDDLLVSSGHGGRGIYDVNLVIRLIRIFVNNSNNNNDLGGAQKMKKVGRLIDKYLGEISPDQKLKISKFLGVAESLPDSARDCFDGVYRAVDIYIESHPSLSLKERSEICRCLNYKKLTLEASKELAKNPRIPPIIAMQALKSQHSKLPTKDEFPYDHQDTDNSQIILYAGTGPGTGTGTGTVDAGSISEENERMRMNLQRMQWRVMELEKVCKEMKGHMHKMVRHNRALPKLC